MFFNSFDLSKLSLLMLCDDFVNLTWILYREAQLIVSGSIKFFDFVQSWCNLSITVYYTVTRQICFKRNCINLWANFHLSRFFLKQPFSLNLDGTCFQYIASDFHVSETKFLERFLYFTSEIVLSVHKVWA